MSSTKYDPEKRLFLNQEGADQPLRSPISEATLKRAGQYRLSRLRQVLKAADCGAILLYDPVNIRYALDERVPLFGICRGYQMINVMMGGSLHVDIRRMRKRTSNFGTILPRKQVELEPDSFIARLTGRSRLRVNSLHYQAVDQVGEELRVTGRDRDDFVQVLEHDNDSPILGVQWHPEYLFYLPSHLRLFRWLVGQALKHAARRGRH